MAALGRDKRRAQGQEENAGDNHAGSDRGGAGAIGALALPARAGEYPDHAIKMIVPFAAGGTDVIARIIAQNLNAKWGQPVVVENQPGASARSAPAP
jgi:tripartite-type tricarboxylate transporter receptor subunit TctC